MKIYLPIERLVAYYGRDLQGLHLPFNFALLSTAWQARLIAGLIDEYEFALPSGGWPNWVLGNHDRPRIASRIGEKQARCVAMLILTLRGTPTIYYGDEIGMRQAICAAVKSKIRLKKECRVWVWAGMDAAHQCNGMVRDLRDFPPQNPGFRSN